VRSMVPQGSATLTNMGVIDFNSITPASLQALSYSSTPIDGNNDATNQLVANDVFAVRTNKGNVAKVQIESYGYNLQIRWVTYAATKLCTGIFCIHPLPTFVLKP